MPSLSERAKQVLDWSKDYTNTNFVTSLVARMMPEVASVIESLTETNHALAAKQEASELRIEELEAQVTALAPPKSVGPVIPIHEQLKWDEDTPRVRWACKTIHGWYYYWADGHYMLPDTFRSGNTPQASNANTAKIICQADFDTRQGIPQCHI